MLSLLGQIDWAPALVALGFLVLAIGLLVLEFFVVSFGLLLVASLASVGASLYYAFAAGEIVGWVFVVAVPLIGYFTTRWGLQRVRESKLVAQGEISSEAGYHHALDRISVAPGAVGEMVTMARPTGRARFAGGECDVQVRGRPLERGARVRVEAIDGPMVFVTEVIEEAGNET